MEVQRYKFAHFDADDPNVSLVQNNKGYIVTAVDHLAALAERDARIKELEAEVSRLTHLAAEMKVQLHDLNQHTIPALKGAIEEERGWRTAAEARLAAFAAFADPATGEPRKVLGVLPLTRDGFIIGDDCKIWCEGEYVNAEPFRSSLQGESGWHPFLCHRVWSSSDAEAAALAARGGGQ